VTAKKKI